MPAYVKSKTGLLLPPEVTSLRHQQRDVLEWALDRHERYLLVNAPTGSGKTLINLLYGMMRGEDWTYAVHTVRLQRQVEASLAGIPVLTGRANHPCLIAHLTHGFEITAEYGICTVGEDCDHRLPEDDSIPQCPYYGQLDRALTAPFRVTNYSMYLALTPLRLEGRTDVLVADEAHNIESILTGANEVVITIGALHAIGYGFPKGNPASVWAWRGWSFGILKRTDAKDPRPVVRDLRQAALGLVSIKSDEVVDWSTSFDGKIFRARPLWGAKYTNDKLLGRTTDPDNPLAGGYSGARVLMTSATLMGADYMAEKLGLKDGMWASLDLPSTFPVEHRPVNFAPVVSMNRDRMSTVEGREPMQTAMDNLIQRYVLAGSAQGIIHAVSNKYRDQILTESRWRGIMNTDSAAHEAAVRSGKASVLVAANLTEGYDGYDNLCRFVLMPKVPFADLSEPWTRERRNADPRTYDHQALVSVVQGVGRGVRHAEDYCDSWILDAAWASLYRRHSEWLPQAFQDAYRHNVKLS